MLEVPAHGTNMSILWHIFLSLWHILFHFFYAFLKNAFVFIVIQCAVHGEQYIMFSNTQKTMLCVNCFRDTPAEARLHCVDIDTAYSQGCKKLDRAVMVSVLPHAILEAIGDVLHYFVYLGSSCTLFYCSSYSSLGVEVNHHSL